jgi:hypothetical protein
MARGDVQEVGAPARGRAVKPGREPRNVKRRFGKDR